MTTIFTPEGRLLQVEYAINNINNAGLCLGIVTAEGIFIINLNLGVILACEKESSSKLLEKGKYSEKIYKIDSNIAVGVGGLAADANLLIDYAREFSQNYYYKYKSHTPVENIVRYISDVKQLKTQFGSTRPYGAGFLFAGYDRIHGYQLYNTEPSGVYNTWKAHAIGQNYQSAQSSLKQYYDDNLTLKDGITLTVRVLKKTLDKNKLSGDNIDIFILENVNGDLVQRFMTAKDVDEHLKSVIELEKAEELSKQK